MVRVGRLIEAAHAPAQACFGVTFRRIAGLASRQSRPWPTPHPALSCVCVGGGCGLARGSTQSEQLAVFTRSRCRGASDSTKSGSARAPSARQAAGQLPLCGLWGVGHAARLTAAVAKHTRHKHAASHKHTSTRPVNLPLQFIGFLRYVLYRGNCQVCLGQLVAKLMLLSYRNDSHPTRKEKKASASSSLASSSPSPCASCKAPVRLT